MSPASPRRSFTPTIRRVPGNFEVARLLAAMAPRLVGRAATSSAGRSGCAVVIGAAQPTDQSSVAASIACAADRGFVAVLSRHRYRGESPTPPADATLAWRAGLARLAAVLAFSPAVLAPRSEWRRHRAVGILSGASAVDLHLHLQLRCQQPADERPQPEEHGRHRRQARQLSISEAGWRRVELGCETSSTERWWSVRSNLPAQAGSNRRGGRAPRPLPHMPPNWAADLGARSPALAAHVTQPGSWSRRTLACPCRACHPTGQLI